MKTAWPIIVLCAGCAPLGTEGLVCEDDQQCDPGQRCVEDRCQHGGFDVPSMSSTSDADDTSGTTVGAAGDDSTTNDATTDGGPSQCPPDIPGQSGTPVWLARASGFHSCAILLDRRVKCWGSNQWGQLGQGSTVSFIGNVPGTMADNLPQIQFGSDTYADRVAMGFRHSCAVMVEPPASNDEGSGLRCFGSNDWGQLGLGSAVSPWGIAPAQMQGLPEIDLGGGERARDVVVGEDFTCALLESDQIKCWGRNDEGQLGYEDTNPRGAEQASAPRELDPVPLGTGFEVHRLAAGSYHVCAMSTDRTEVKCWGLNTMGQLGLGDADNRGHAPLTMGNALLPTDLGVAGPVLMVAAGHYHTCALFDDGRVKCWGFNDQGQLGLGTTTLIVGDEPQELGDALDFVNLGGHAATWLAAGDRHTCARLDDGQVKCWGSNSQGQLGVGNQGDGVGKQPEDMGIALQSAELGTGRKAKSITAGIAHTCAILDDDSLKCWGGNDSGQLGLEDTEPRGRDPCTIGDFLPPVRL